MSLFSLYFYALFAIVLVCTAFISKFFSEKASNKTFQKLLLLFASAIFICFASWKALICIFVVSFITWFCGKQKQKTWQYIGITVLVLTLVFYKFADAKQLNIIVPLGVSFFTFSAISYLVDISRNEIKAKDFLSVVLYLSFFLKLTSGPIQKSSDFFAQIDKNRNINQQNLSAGLQIYCFGLFKKLVLADHLSVFVNEVFSTPNAFSGFSILLAILSYSLQIYFDFSGYSDMAIGTGKMLGFELPKNFNMPYLSRNVTEFWRRWHISLSTWIRDYIYISIGGNRKGKLRQNLNLLVAMTLCGLWHGATLNFILWGFLHGVALLVQKNFKRMAKPFSAVLTFSFVSLLWVLFRSENLNIAIQIYKRLFTLAAGLNQPYLWTFISIIVFIISTVFVKKNDGESFYPILDLKKFLI